MMSGECDWEVVGVPNSGETQVPASCLFLAAQRLISISFIFV